MRNYTSIKDKLDHIIYTWQVYKKQVKKITSKEGY